MNIPFRILLFSVFLSFAFPAWSQHAPSRSGFPAPQESASSLRFFPCGGQLIWEENFRADTLPAGWQAIRLDTGTVHRNLAPDFQAGWQSIQDFKNPNSRSVASPSWYNEDSVRSDNWLITPQVTLGPNTCLSWFAYSQDRYFEESYEVRISTNTPSPDSMGFLAEPPLFSVEKESSILNYRSLNLSAYAGQQIYIAFRQTSLNRFMLVLDDVRFAEAPLKDIGVYALEEVLIPAGDSTLLRASIRNYGSDTLSLDSTVIVAYTVNGTDTVRASLLDDTTFVNLSPNDTFLFNHPIQWKPADSGAFWICMWTEWDLDENTGNDSSCARAGVGIDFTRVEPGERGIPVEVFPNPASEQLYLSWEPQQSRMEVMLFDALGRKALAAQSLPPGARGASLTLQGLPAGIYYVRVHDEQGRQFSRKIVKE